MNQFIVNLLHTFDLKNNYLDEEDNWAGILADNYFMLWIMYHKILQATPCHTVFRHDMIVSIHLIYDWEAIRRRKQ